MKATAPTPAAFATGRLARLNEEIKRLLADPSHFAPTKAKDDKEIVIGSLDDFTMLKGYYLLREHRRETVADIVAAIGDLDAAHFADHQHRGAGVTDADCQQFSEKVTTLLEQMNPPYEEFQVADKLLMIQVNAEFGEPDGREVIGFRKDFQIVARHDNSRGDYSSPTAGLKEMKIVRVIGEGVVTVKMPGTPSIADLFGVSGIGGLGGGIDLLDLIIGLGGPRRRTEPSQPSAPAKPQGPGGSSK